MTNIYFSVLEAGKFRINLAADLVFGERPHLVCRWLSSPYILIGLRTERSSKLTSVSSFKDTNPIRSSSLNIITLRIWVSIYEFWRDTNIQPITGTIHIIGVFCNYYHSYKTPLCYHKKSSIISFLVDYKFWENW